MPSKPTQPPGGYAPDNRPTSPPPPRKKEPTLDAKNNEQATRILQLTAQFAAAQLRLEKYECPSCGDSEQIVECHHDGETCGLPECDFKHCNACGHQWGQN